jgi:hypothetical protein
MGPSVAYTVVFLFSVSVVVSRGPNPAPAVLTPQGLDALHDYGAARGLSFVALGPQPQLSGRGLPAYDAALVDRLESELEHARTSLSALEEEAAKERLGRIEAELLAHPHLPQVAFLMAECLALKAQAAGATPQATEWREQREALEGPRALAFGETQTASPAAGTPLPLALDGLALGDEVEVDGQGQARGERRVSLLPGLHHFRVLRAGRPVFAAFRAVQAAEQRLRLEVPPLAPCSHDDLASVDARLLAAGAPPPAGVACERFAIVRPESSGVSVALCGRKGCGPLVHWQRRRKTAPFTPIAIDRSRLPSWAGFAIAGAGAALATSLVLWQSGALDRGQRAAGTLEYGGLNP